MNTCHLLCPSFMIKEPMQFAGEQIMLMSHCYLNCLLHHTQSNLNKIIASDRCICAKLQPGAENCIQQLMMAGCQIWLVLEAQVQPLFTVPLLHVTLVHAESWNSVKVKNKSKPQKC